jgi:hypothetical protein
VESNGKLLLKLAWNAAYQSHTGRLTGLWFLPKQAQKLNTTITTTTTNNNNNNNNNNMDENRNRISANKVAEFCRH